MKSQEISVIRTHAKGYVGICTNFTAIHPMADGKG